MVGLRTGFLLFITRFLSQYIFRQRYQPYGLEALKRGYSQLVGWLVVCGFNGLLRQYFSLYRSVSQREGDR